MVFKQAVGKATRAPNRKFLMRKIREAAGAQSSYPLVLALTKKLWVIWCANEREHTQPANTALRAAQIAATSVSATIKSRLLPRLSSS